MEHDRDALTYGPYDTLFPGKYRVTFRLKWNGEQGDAPVAGVDAFSTAAGYALNSLELKPGDFLTSDHYQSFVLELEPGQTLPDIEYRVHYLGRGRLSVDDIEVISVRVTIPKTGESIPLAN